MLHLPLALVSQSIRPARESVQTTKFINGGRATLSFIATTVGDPIRNLSAGWPANLSGHACSRNIPLNGNKCCFLEETHREPNAGPGRRFLFPFEKRPFNFVSGGFLTFFSTYLFSSLLFSFL